MKRRSFLVTSGVAFAAGRLTQGPALAAFARGGGNVASVGLRRHALAPGVPGRCANRRGRSPGAAYTLEYALAGLRVSGPFS